MNKKDCLTLIHSRGSIIGCFLQVSYTVFLRPFLTYNFGISASLLRLEQRQSVRSNLIVKRCRMHDNFLSE